MRRVYQTLAQERPAASAGLLCSLSPRNVRKLREFYLEGIDKVLDGSANRWGRVAWPKLIPVSCLARRVKWMIQKVEIPLKVAPFAFFFAEEKEARKQSVELEELPLVHPHFMKVLTSPCSFMRISCRFRKRTIHPFEAGQFEHHCLP